MRFRTIIIALIALAFGGQARAQALDAPLGPQEFSSVDELAAAFAAYFPKVQGRVSAVQGDRLTLSLGKKDGMLEGMELVLWRPDKEIRHPVTNAVIGTTEVEVGTVEVVAADEASSTALVRKKAKEPKIGDRVRITPRKINFGIVPLRGDRDDVLQGLADRLNEQGRFAVADPKKVAAFLQSHKQRDTSLVRELCSSLQLDAAAAVDLVPDESKILVTAKIFYADEAKPLDTIIGRLTLASKRQALGDVRPFFAPGNEAAGKSPALPVDARYVVFADLDGDGKADYLISDERRLHILRLEPSGWTETWTETVPTSETGSVQFHIDAANINGTGTPEIFVTRMLNDRITSYVLEYRDGSYKRIADVPGFLRVTSWPGKGRILVGQEYDPKTLYAGPVKEYVWSGGTYMPGDALPLPNGTTIYGFVTANFGDVRPLVVAYDGNSHIVVYSGDTAVWRSVEVYAPMKTAVVRPRPGVEAAVSGGAQTGPVMAAGDDAPDSDRDRTVFAAGRMFAFDADGDGKDDLALSKNISAGFLGGFKGGEVQVLSWTGSRFDPKWSIKDIPGPVLDFQAAPLEKGGVRVDALVGISGGLFSRDTVRLESYERK